jgi:hypothetical protein
MCLSTTILARFSFVFSQSEGDTRTPAAAAALFFPHPSFISFQLLIRWLFNLLEGKSFACLHTGIQSSNSTFTFRGKKSHDGHQNCSNSPSRLPVFWMVSCNAQADFFMKFKSSIGLDNRKKKIGKRCKSITVNVAPLRDNVSLLFFGACIHPCLLSLRLTVKNIKLGGANG